MPGPEGNRRQGLPQKGDRSFRVANNGPWKSLNNQIKLATRTAPEGGQVIPGREQVQKTVEKSMEIRDKWPPGEGTIHSRLRTTYRDGAVGFWKTHENH